MLKIIKTMGYALIALVLTPISIVHAAADKSASDACLHFADGMFYSGDIKLEGKSCNVNHKSVQEDKRCTYSSGKLIKAHAGSYQTKYYDGLKACGEGYIDVQYLCVSTSGRDYEHASHDPSAPLCEGAPDPQPLFTKISDFRGNFKEACTGGTNLSKARKLSCLFNTKTTEKGGSARMETLIVPLGCSDINLDTKTGSGLSCTKEWVRIR
jgi:hypothetical protein